MFLLYMAIELHYEYCMLYFLSVRNYLAGSPFAGNFFSFFRIMSIAYSYPFTPQPIYPVPRGFSSSS